MERHLLTLENREKLTLTQVSDVDAFDENILWRDTDLSLGKGIYGEAILQPGQTLMEIKTPGNIPLWMVEVLSKEQIRKTSFSKYGNAYQMIWKKEKGESQYA